MQKTLHAVEKPRQCLRLPPETRVERLHTKQLWSSKAVVGARLPISNWFSPRLKHIVPSLGTRNPQHWLVATSQVLARQLGHMNLKRGGQSWHWVGRGSQGLVHLFHKEMRRGRGDRILLIQGENHHVNVEGVVHVAGQLLRVQPDRF